MHSEGVLIRSSEATNSAGPSVTVVLLHLHFPSNRSIFLFHDSDLIIDVVKKEVAILRMHHDDVVAVFLDLSLEPTDSTFKLKMIKVHFSVRLRHMHSRLLPILRVEATQTTKVPQTEVNIFNMLFKEFVRLFLGLTKCAGESCQRLRLDF